MGIPVSEQRHTVDVRVWVTTAASGATTAEFKSSLVAAIAAMIGFKDDRRDPMALSASGLAGVLPTTMPFTALVAINSTVIANTSNVLDGAARLIAFPWLTEAGVRPFLVGSRPKTVASGSSRSINR